MGKLDKILTSMKKEGLDGLLITSAVNRRYMTGFTGTAGVVLINEKQPIFITDFRYIEQANEQVKEFDIIEHKQPIGLEVRDQVEKLGLQRIGFEKDDMTYALYESYQKELSVEFVPTSGLVENLRLFKNEEEISVMKEAARITDKAFDHILNFIKPGVKEIDVSNELEFTMRKLGATQSSFDTIVASGYRSALPHGVASNKEIQSGELVTLDYGALYNGYCSDITRTVAVGNISDELNEIYHTVLEAQLKGLAGIKAGITAKQADDLTRDHIKSKGYGEYFGHSTGHGLGLEVHEGPGLSYRSTTVLEAGMVVTVEPGIYVPGVGGCRIEDDILVTKDGNDRLTHSPKELITL